MNFTLAAGNQQRWNENNDTGIKVKQLIEIEGETLIERIARQFGGYVVTHNEAIMNATSQQVIRPTTYRWLIDTMYATKEYWKWQTIITLGDVYYTEEAARMIREYDGGLMFFGDLYDIYAISFNNHYFVKENLEAVISIHERHPNFKRNGRLWTLYRRCNGLDIGLHYIPSAGNFTYILDKTRDFDTIEDYAHREL